MDERREIIPQRVRAFLTSDSNRRVEVETTWEIALGYGHMVPMCVEVCDLLMATGG